MSEVAPMDVPLVSKLNELIAHDRAAYDVCDAAASRIDAIDWRARIRDIADDHLRRIDRLSRHVSQLGGKPTYAKHDLACDRREVRALQDDQEVLAALSKSEQNVTDVYGQAVDSVKEDPLREIVERGARHQQRHQRWLRSNLQ